MTSALPRFNGPAQARQRMRLIAAIGVLAIAALTTGGLASLTAGRPTSLDEEPAPTRSTGSEHRAPVDVAAVIEVQVEDAEREVQSARAMIRNARRLGLVDGQLLDEYERRLDQTAAGRPPDAVADPSSSSRELPPSMVRQPRAL